MSILSTLKYATVYAIGFGIGYTLSKDKEQVNKFIKDVENKLLNTFNMK